MAKTPADKLEDAIRGILEEYAGDIQKNVDEAAVRVGKAGAAALRASSRQSFGGTGKYAKGWKATVEAARTGTKVTLHNTVPGLPHLLEHGHAKRGGGRVKGIEHIAPVEKEITENFEKAVKEAIR